MSTQQTKSHSVQPGDWSDLKNKLDKADKEVQTAEKEMEEAEQIWLGVDDSAAKNFEFRVAFEVYQQKTKVYQHKCNLFNGLARLYNASPKFQY